MANESYYTRKLRKALEKHGWFHKISDRFSAGIPDLLGCVGGRTVAIEMKMAGNTPTDLQIKAMADLVMNGAAVFLVTYHKVKAEYHCLVWHNCRAEARLHTAEEAAAWLLKQIYTPISRTPLTVLGTSLTTL